MEILHPYITLGYIFLMFFSYKEVYAKEYTNYKGVWLVMIYLVIIAGFRTWGPDYKSYILMYEEFGNVLSFNLESLENNQYGIEWLYVLYNKIIHVTGLTFVVFTVLTAILTIFTKYYVFDKNSVYPAFSFLLFLTPTFFMGDMGHMRQAIATCITFLAFYPIKKRKLWLFIILMFLAKGFHNSSFVFIAAYFIAILPLSRWMLLFMVVACMILSPFEVYNNIPFMDSIAPDDVVQGFENYIEIVDENTDTIKFYDLLSLFYFYFIFFYDKEAKSMIPYYEYMRNIGVMGICIYFIFRASPIFSTRLVSYYFLYMVLVIPNIIASIRNVQLRRYLFSVVMLFVVFYYFVFANMQGKRSFTTNVYENYILP